MQTAHVLFATILTISASACTVPSASSDGVDGGTGPQYQKSPRHGDPVTDYPRLADLLGEVEGWASGVTGGLDGTIFVVDTLDDSGSRSLRAALTSRKPHWIVFDDGLNGTITLASTINVRANRTIDARGHRIKIRTKGGGRFTAMQLKSQSNVIFTNLDFDDRLSDWDRDGEGSDAITIFNSTYIWIHHCSFDRWKDGAIDIRYDKGLSGGLSSRISVTWSRFERIFQAVNWTADKASFGHNHCDRVRKRCIKIIDGRAHSWNNLIEGWSDKSIQIAKGDGVLVSDYSIFDPDGYNQVNKRDGDGQIYNNGHHAVGDVSFLGGNDSVSRSFRKSSRSLAQRTRCDANDDTCWRRLRERLVSGAGAR